MAVFGLGWITGWGGAFRRAAQDFLVLQGPFISLKSTALRLAVMNYFTVTIATCAWPPRCDALQCCFMKVAPQNLIFLYVFERLLSNLCPPSPSPPYPCYPPPTQSPTSADVLRGSLPVCQSDGPRGRPLLCLPRHAAGSGCARYSGGSCTLRGVHRYTAVCRRTGG